MAKNSTLKATGKRRKKKTEKYLKSNRLLKILLIFLYTNLRLIFFIVALICIPFNFSDLWFRFIVEIVNIFRLNK